MLWWGCLGLSGILTWSGAWGQTCVTSAGMEAAVRAGIEAAGQKYFALAAKGDVAGLKASAIPSVAADFSGIQAAALDNQNSFSKAQAVVRSTFELIAEGNAPLERGEFVCGVFGKTGQTATSAEFVLNGLPPGQYGIVILDVSSKAATDDGPWAVAFVLQQVTGEWKLGGFNVKALRSGGHDSAWFAEKGRAFAVKSETHNAWYYLLEARNLATVAPFMSTRVTDQLYEEARKVAPADAPDGVPKELAGTGEGYRNNDAVAYGGAVGCVLWVE